MSEDVKRHRFYCIAHIENLKKYIGQSVNIINRWNNHKKSVTAKEPEQVIGRAIKKHGVQAFTFTVIASGTLPCTCTRDNPGPCQDEANDIEKFLIIQHESHISTGKGYNVSWGGGCHPVSDKTRLAIRLAQKGKHNSPETEFKKGHKLSPESLKKLSDSRRGKPNLKNRGRIMPEHVKQALRLSRLGHTPWNKGMKLGPSWNAGLSKYTWPEDQELINIVNDIGLSAFSRKLGCAVGLVAVRMKNKGLKHNRLAQHPETQFKNGEEHLGAILVSKEVLEIVAMYKTNNYTQKELGELFGIARMTISAILTGRTWSHLTGIKPEDYIKTKSFTILKPEQVLEIVSFYNKNYTQAEISKLFNISKLTVNRIIRGESWANITGITPQERPPKYFTPDQILKIVALSKGGQSRRELSKIYNVNETTIGHIVTGRSWSHLTGIIPPPKKIKPSQE